MKKIFFDLLPYLVTVAIVINGTMVLIGYNSQLRNPYSITYNELKLVFVAWLALISGINKEIFRYIVARMVEILAITTIIWIARIWHNTKGCVKVIVYGIFIVLTYDLYKLKLRCLSANIMCMVIHIVTGSVILFHVIIFIHSLYLLFEDEVKRIINVIYSKIKSIILNKILSKTIHALTRILIQEYHFGQNKLLEDIIYLSFMLAFVVTFFLLSPATSYEYGIKIAKSRLENIEAYSDRVKIFCKQNNLPEITSSKEYYLLSSGSEHIVLVPTDNLQNLIVINPASLGCYVKIQIRKHITLTSTPPPEPSPTLIPISTPFPAKD